MGVGAAASEPGTLSLIRHIYPEREERAIALGVWAAVSGLALALGPGDRRCARRRPAAGAGSSGSASGSAQRSASRWPRSRSPRAATPKGGSSTCPGLATGAAAITAATFAVIEGENRGYGTWWIVVLFAAAAVLTVAFVLVEHRVADPVLKLEFIRNPTFAAANVVAFAANLSVFSVFFFTALYLQLISNFTGYQIALVFTSLAVAMIVSGLDCGSLDGARWAAGADGRRLRPRRRRAPARRRTAHCDDERRGARLATRDRGSRLRDRARHDDRVRARDRATPSSRAWLPRL